MNQKNKKNMILEEKQNLKNGGIQVIRFKNEEVENEIENVIDKIKQVCINIKKTV